MLATIGRAQAVAQIGFVRLSGLSAWLLWCVVQAFRARSAGLADADLRARLQPILIVNLAALGVSALGLILVVLGITLG